MTHPPPQREEDVDALLREFFDGSKGPRTAAAESPTAIPFTSVRRLMKDGHEDCNVSNDAYHTMVEATQNFIQVMTMLAWELSANEQKRATLQMRDIKTAIYSSQRFAFLMDTFDIHEQNTLTPAYTLKLPGSPDNVAARAASSTSTTTSDALSRTTSSSSAWSFDLRHKGP